MKTIYHHDFVEFFPDVYSDDRGQFLEIFSTALREWSMKNEIVFVQDNLSISKKGTIRGMHFQNDAPQGKLISVIKGSVLDVVVDIRSSSKTIGQKFYFRLDDKKRNLLWIPPGYAHGFQALEDDTIFLYKVTQQYDANDEGSINPMDEGLGITWDDGLAALISEKDSSAQSFDNFLRGI